jgi:small subunit ribosomal protein S2e
MLLALLRVQVATAIRGAIILAKMSVIPVRRGYWGNKIGKVHTVPTKVTGKCGSVTIRLIPAPRGAGRRFSVVGLLL